MKFRGAHAETAEGFSTPTWGRPSCRPGPYGRSRTISRIGFLFNHDQVHQVAHSLPIALQLIEHPAAEVTLIVTNDRLAEAVRAMAGNAMQRAHFVQLAPRSRLSRAGAALLDRLAPVRKLAVYRDHLDLFRGFDALVVSEKSSLVLKTHYGLDKLKLVHTRHGAGDRAIGFNRESALFDLVLVSGRKIRERLIVDAGMRPDRIAVVGYCKFDQFGLHKPRSPIFENGRPTVLYNPHPSPKLSSWYRWGKRILEQFAQQDRYNLIFAPHVMLFTRKLVATTDPPALAWVRRPDVRYRALPHMLVDTGSPASIDMTYTRAADLYLGDVSSQVYEFITHPRPCLFLNTRGIEWQCDPSYRHWQAGPVVDTPEALLGAIDGAMQSFEDFTPVQRALVEETFSITESSAARRGAEAILRLLAERQ